MIKITDKFIKTYKLKQYKNKQNFKFFPLFHFIAVMYL